MSKWNDWKNSLGDARPWHLLDPEKKIRDQSVIDLRMKSCMGCDFFINVTKQCEKCGCFMPAKTTLSNAECPIGKWGKED
jgi:hypothetical protein